MTGLHTRIHLTWVYIMNSDKEEDEKPMIAETPTKQEHYDDVYNDNLSGV